MAKRDYEKVSDDELVNMIAAEVATADTEGTNQLSAQRESSNLAYTGVYTGDLIPTTGMSTVLVNKVKPAVDTLTTYLTKVFTSDKETVVFTPSNADQAIAGKQAQILVNHIIHKKNDGYDTINRWIKDAALNKNGVVKVTWHEDLKKFQERFEDVTMEELYAILAQKESLGYDCKIVEEEIVSEEVTEIDPLTGEELSVGTTRMSVVIECSYMEGYPRIENIPPEEFLINEDASRINGDQQTRFVCHRQLVYVGDLVKMFPEYHIDDFATGSGSSYLNFEYETINRHTFDGTYNYTDDDQGQGPMRQVEVVESWIKADRDGDGYSEWRHCFTSGNVLLMDEEWNKPIPFASFCFFPIPHKFYGMSVYDSIKEYYRQATMLTRSEIDVRTQQNTFRLFANPRFIDQRDLQSGRPGIIKVRPGFSPQDVLPVPTPSGSGNTLQILEYIDAQIEEQIGINPRTGAISRDIEASGNDAEKTSMVIDNASSKVEMYAREFAENGLREVIWQVFNLIVDNKDHPSVKRMVEGLTPGVPLLASNDGMEGSIDKDDLSAKVGLGHMTASQKQRGILAIKQEQTQLEATGVMIPPQKKLAASYELSKALGYENAQEFFPTAQETQQMSAQVQQMVQQAQQQGIQMGMQQAMQQADMQERMAKVQKIAAEIEKIRNDVTIDNREVQIKEREQMLEELLGTSTPMQQLNTNVLI